MIDVILKKGKEKSLLRRHPWVYDTAVARVAARPAAGETVRVVSSEGRVLGLGAYSPASTLRVRMWTFRDDVAVDDPAFLRARLAQAIEAREPLLERTNARRLVFGEADGIPGLIVDAYGPWLVTQFQSAAVEARREEIGRHLMELTGARGVFDRSDAATRRREGLEERIGCLAFFQQHRTLVYTKTLLFVDNHQRAAMKYYIGLQERVRSKQHTALPCTQRIKQRSAL